jgi:hypothetical protein
MSSLLDMPLTGSCSYSVISGVSLSINKGPPSGPSKGEICSYPRSEQFRTASVQRPSCPGHLEPFIPFYKIEYMPYSSRPTRSERQFVTAENVMNMH